MNVRFFGGTKEVYLDIPKHNPIGLYFCADTRELFWGDRLLSDGIRLVHTKTELPEFNSAADGIIYYVVENRTGYVLSPDRAGWFPIFSAPTTDIGSVSESDAYNTAVSVLALRELEKAVYEKIASVENVSGVKTISFAGIELTKVDRVFSIDRETALKALGISIVEGDTSADVKVLATKEYVDTQIDTIPGVNLTGYATEKYVDSEIAKVKVPANISELTNDVGYITVNDIPEIDIPDTSNFITMADVEAQGYLTEHQSLTEYAKKSDIPDTSDFITMQEVEGKNYLTKVPTGFATEEFVSKKIAEAELKDKEVDLEAYYTKSEVNALIPDVSGLIKEIPAEYITESELEDRGYLTEHQSLEGYATKDDIKGFASVSYVDEKIVGIEHPSIPTKTSELENDSGFITSIPKEYITEEDLNAKGFITDQSLSDYAKRDELFSKSYNDLTDKPTIPSVEGLASESFVNEKFDTLEIPEIPTNISAFTNDAGYLTAHQDLSEYAKKTEIPTVDGFATKEELSSAIESIEHPTVNLDNYVTKDEVKDFISEVPAEYITEDELEAKGYLTEHQSLEGLATEEFVAEAIGDIEIPEADLSNYYTKSEVKSEIASDIVVAIADKADNIPFTDDQYITKSVGGFVVGDNINGWTITAILAKLLELSNEKPGTDEPEIPDEPQGVIATIIANQIPMYAITADAELAAIPFNHSVMTETEAAAPCAESGFYQIEDAEGNIIESGYQEIQVKNDEVYYMIALPKAVDYDTMVDIKVYNIKTNLWEPIGVKFDMVSDPTAVEALCEEVSVDISHIDQEQYTILVYEDIPTGSLLRYVIKE